MKNTLKLYYNLLDTIRKNQYEFITEFKDAGADLMHSGNEPLKCAIKHRSFETIEELLEYVEPNYSGNYVGGSPLAHAIRTGLPGVVEMLLEKGVRTETITDHDWARCLMESSGYYYEDLRELVGKYKISQNN